MKLFALKMKLEGFHKDRWVARRDFGISYSDDLNKARLFTKKELTDYQKYCNDAQQTYTFEEAWGVYEVKISIVEDKVE